MGRAAQPHPAEVWAFDAVAARLRRRLADAARPGHDAHLTMAPSTRLDRGLLSVEGKKAREAATLVLVYAGTTDGQASVLLTVRPDTLRTHGGQVAFPGGRTEPGESVEAAALREANEEVGLDARAVEMVGAMTPIYVPPTRFSVYPVVAVAPVLPPLTPSPDEVASLLAVPLGVLFAPSTRLVGAWDTSFGLSNVPHYLVRDDAGVERRIWGATAMMLAELGVLVAP